MIISIIAFIIVIIIIIIIEILSRSQIILGCFFFLSLFFLFTKALRLPTTNQLVDVYF